MDGSVERATKEGSYLPEHRRAARAMVLGSILGVVLALLSRRR
jgi:hypothetical protein